MEEEKTVLNYDKVEDTQDPDALEILKGLDPDNYNGDSPDDEEETDEDNLDSKSDDFDDIDKLDDSDDNDDIDDEPKDKKLFAKKYATIDALKQGIKELNSTLPQYIIDGLSDEALESHYYELRKEFSSKDRKFSKGKEKEEPTTDEKTDDKSDDKQDDKNDNKKEDVNLLLSQAESMYFSEDGLTDEMYDRLEKAGFPSQVVDRHIEVANKERQIFTNQVYDIAGGAENYNKIKAWAENGGVSEEELLYVGSIKDNTTLLGVLKSISDRYRIANQGSKRIVGETGSKNRSGSFKTQDDYIKAVSDVRYERDESYRKEVDRKLAKSKWS